MTADEHAATAAMLLAESANLARQPRTALAAGELVWGATIHALNAIAHHERGNSRHLRQGRDLENLITQVAPDDATQTVWMNGLHTAQRRLHNHFYTGQLSDATLMAWMDVGINSVGELLQFAERGYFDDDDGNGGGAPAASAA